ncbi:MAG TPA: PQQ-dependent sugar dehydrogenase [Baekduia sp.]|jgi:glucose/arabinose dehydrogenase|nr:PQQ-dependent sugar dehydrogenase [Baekduia sp.]
MTPLRMVMTLCCAAALAACGGSSATTTGAAPASDPAAGPVPATVTVPTAPGASASAGGAVRTLVTGLDVPWGLAFLPGGDALVGERDSGQILRIPKGGGTPRRVMTITSAFNDGGEGGLLGLAASPAYATDHLVYAYVTTRTDNRIVRFRLGGAVKPILTGLRRGTIHDGGRIAFGPDRKLYAGVGETGQAGLAQDPSSRNGKILRMNADGSAPSDNPFDGSLVYSLGHRNVQGLAWDAKGRLWESEFGQNRFDEVNLIRPGRNYGWPVVEGVGDTAGGKYTNPLVTWPTSEASPSGAAIVGNTMYIGALQGRDLLRVRLSGTSARKLTPWLAGRFGRLRTVVRAPDGALWVTTSNRDGRGVPRSGDDRILRVSVG